MLRFSPTFATLTLATLASAMYNETRVVQVTPNSMNDILHISGPFSQPEVTGLITDSFAFNSNVTKDAVGDGAQRKITDTFDINTNVYVPLKPKDVCIFAIHGIAYDSNYWDISVPSDPIDYSFVSAATAQGYPVMTYDRLGTGKSSKPDGVQVVQAQIQVDIMYDLIEMLKKGEMGRGLKCRKVAAVGHSFGSIQLLGLTAYYPSAVDAAILTGFSSNSSGTPVTMNAIASSLAKDDEKFQDLNDTSYLVVGNTIGAQIGFLDYQNATEAATKAAYAARETLTLGEIFTLTVPRIVAKAFTGAVSIVTGRRDGFMCLNNCFAGPNGSSLLLGASSLWPKASRFDTHVVPETGHGINYHTTAPEAYKYILDFVKSLNL